MKLLNSIIAIGPQSNMSLKRFSGQSVMFDGAVRAFQERVGNVDVVDILSSSTNSKTYKRILDYIVIVIKLFCKCLFKKYDAAYYTSSFGKFGIYRDIIIISILLCFKVKIVLHQFGADLSGISTVKPFFKKRLQNQLQYVSSIIVEGHYMESLFSDISIVKGKVVVIPNGLPIEGMNANHPKQYNPQEPFRMFYLSNLIYSKGWFDVLQAVDILINREHRKVECIFAGRFMSSPDDQPNNHNTKQFFDDYVKDHQIVDSVRYMVGLYGDEKDEAFSSHHVFLLPSYYINEGQPVSILEAMAYGCVPIVTNYRHIPMMVNDTNGCFVNAESPQEIVSAVIDLMANPALYNKKSCQCITDYNTKFKFDVYIQQIMNVLEDAVNE